MPVAPSDLHAIVRAVVLAPNPLDRYRPSSPRREVQGDLLLVQAVADDRHVIALGPATAAQLAAAAARFFGTDARFSVELVVGEAGPLAEELRRQGWRLEEEEPALVLTDPPATPPHLPPDLTIRPVADEASLADVRGLSAAAVRHIPSLAAATDPAVALFVGYVAGRPVATARLTCLGPFAEIHSVNTAPAFRRRGFGTALTWAAIAEGAHRGCTSAMLTATAMGYPLYVRMGFQSACLFRTYRPPE